MVKAKKHAVSIDRDWGWLLGLGVLFIVLGCIGLSMTVGLTMFSMFFIGALFIVAGIAQMIDGFQCKPWAGALWHTFLGLMYMVGGGVIIYDPILASFFFTALLAWLLIIMGITRLYMSYVLRDSKAWGWMLLAGITTFILGVLILMQWPFSALWIFGMLIAIELIVNGWTYVFIAMGMRI